MTVPVSDLGDNTPVSGNGVASLPGLVGGLQRGQEKLAVPQISLTEWMVSWRSVNVNGASRTRYPKHAWEPNRDILGGMVMVLPVPERSPVTNPGNRGAF